MKSQCLRMALVVCLFSGVNAMAAAPVVSTRPVLFVHGFSPFGLPIDCKGTWGQMEKALTADGFAGPMVTVGYYEDDANCDVLSSPKGSILNHITDTGKDFAWFVYDQYTSKGIAVDVVAHSMGGLVTRYALQEVAAANPAFPPSLSIAHATTLGSPFTGYSLLAELCHINVLNIECDDMFPASSFIEGLKSSLDPQGQGGTVWNNVGSNADIFDGSDGVVGSGSATSMSLATAAKDVLPWTMFVFHTVYYKNTKVINWVAQALSDGAFKAGAAVKTHLVAKAMSEGLPRIVLSRAEVTTDFSQVSQDRRPAALQPNLVAQASGEEEMEGVQVSNVLAGGIFDQMGIENGDIVEGCTPAEQNAPFAAIEELEAPTDAVSFDLCIQRAGKEIREQVVVR